LVQKLKGGTRRQHDTITCLQFAFNKRSQPEKEESENRIQNQFIIKERSL